MDKIKKPKHETQIHHYIILLVVIMGAFLLMFSAKPGYMFTVSDAYMNADQAYHLYLGDGLYLKSNGVLFEPIQGPGYPLIVAFFFMIFGVSDNALIYTNILFAALLITLTFLLGKELFNTRVGLIASFILILSPLFLLQSVASLNDIVAAFSSTLAIYLTILFVKTHKYRYFIISMIALWFSLLAKYHHVLAILVIIGIILYYKLHHGTNLNLKKCCLISIVTFTIILTPFLVYNYNNHGNILPAAYQFYDDRGSGSIVNMITIPEHLYTYLSYIFLNVNAGEYILWYNQLFSLFTLIGLVCLMLDIEGRRKAVLFGLWCGIYVIFFSVFTLNDGYGTVRYLLPALIPISLMIAYGCEYIGSKVSNKQVFTFLNIETESSIKGKRNKEKRNETNNSTPYLVYMLVGILMISAIFYISNYAYGLQQRGEWSYIKEAGVYINQNTPTDSLILSKNSYALDFYARRDVIEINATPDNMFYMDKRVRKNISELLHEKRLLYTVQVNVGYQGFMAREDITDSYNALKNVSMNYKLIKIKEMPQFILYKVELI